MGLSTSIESDLSYHTMLGQHIRSSLPDSRNLSPQALMQLGLPPKETLEKLKVRENGGKKKTGTGQKVGSKESNDLKPFKRQSYHVAIAYHIYMRQVKEGSNPNATNIDPTFNARKLRDESLKPK